MQTKSFSFDISVNALDIASTEIRLHRHKLTKLSPIETKIYIKTLDRENKTSNKSACKCH